MISVLTLTYRRHYLLEEAIQSFLEQDFEGPSELVIINDSGIKYVYNNDKVRIINVEKRFSSIGEKLSFGFSKCKYEYIYRLDDDDLLAPWALSYVARDIINHPNYEIYRSDGHYFFQDNQFIKISGSVNNGNVYTKGYLSRIEIPKCSFGEDYEMTFNNNAKIYESNHPQKTMIYRWGMNTYHISGMGAIANEAINEWTDQIVYNEENLDNKNNVILLHPHFNMDYYRSIKEIE